MIEIKSNRIDTILLHKEIDKNVKKHTTQPKKKKISQSQKIQNHYTVEDFFRYNDKEFVEQIYLKLLKTTVDASSLHYYLDLLRSGKKSKGEILSLIRFSKEGRKQNIKVKGIIPRYLMTSLYKVPFLGYISKTIVTLLTMPKLVRRYNSFEAMFLMNLKHTSDAISQKVDYEQFNFELEKKHTEITELKQMIESLKNENKNLHKKLEFHTAEVNDAKTYIRDSQQHLKKFIQNLEVSFKQENMTNGDVLDMIAKEKEHVLDNFYIAFENRFRGSREDIKQRQAYYIPLVNDVKKDDNFMLLDIGCGRGEWLELLKEYDLKAKGIDLNRSMVSKANEYGLDVRCEDAISYLKELDDESLDVISAFHVVEHISFEMLMILFDESLRVLKKSGMIIFETPNPENIFVGSCNFYIDPTHINPIPPVTLEFIAQNRGFSNVSIHRLHRIKKADFLDGEKVNDINILIENSTKEQDYSIIGYKI